ncbi:MAG: alpha/beta hydrolase [Myxococcota bacterium]
MHRGKKALLALVLGAVALGGCQFIKSPQVPMRGFNYEAAGPEQADGLVVLLGGFGDTPEHFQDYGFVEWVLENTNYDVVTPDAHFGYYRTGTISPRLRDDVIGPARRAGYREIWLVGISMGGFGALSYATDYREEVAGVILLAPYLGTGEVVESVREAGGIRSWTPPESLADVSDPATRVSYQMWALLKGWVDNPDAPPVYIGFGAQDGSSENHRLLGAALPESHVASIEGGHKWVIWAPLFRTLAARAFPASGPAVDTSTVAAHQPER